MRRPGWVEVRGAWALAHLGVSQSFSSRIRGLCRGQSPSLSLLTLLPTSTRPELRCGELPGLYP